MEKMIERFIHRLESYSRALARLSEIVELLEKQRSYSLFPDEVESLNEEIRREALIKRFEFTQELSWNLLRGYLIYQGVTEIGASRDTYRRSLQLGLIDDENWMKMIQDRCLLAYDYDIDKFYEMADRIIDVYYPLLAELKAKMEIKKEELIV